MSNLIKAFEALSYVKDRISLGNSDNKKFREVDHTTLQAMERQLLHNQKSYALGQLRQNKHFPGVESTGGYTDKNVRKYGKTALKAGRGNCLEYCCAVVAYLKKGTFVYDVVHYGTEGDHIFTVIGQPRPGEDHKYPQDFATWAADAAVCDVWADIACPVRDYPVRWRARMDNWVSAGIMLGTRSPNDTVWYNIVDKPKLGALKD